jgi:hypothetical protein
MTEPDRPYFQLEQAREVASVFSRFKIEYLFIGKGGAIILGYPAATQDVDLFPRKSAENGRRIVAALRELGFDFDQDTAQKIVQGVDFVQLKDGPFDLDLVFAPDGIESFEAADKRKHLIDEFPVANIRDIIESKKASRREKDLVDLPLLEDFRDEFEKSLRGSPKTSVEIALERTDSFDDIEK